MSPKIPATSPHRPSAERAYRGIAALAKKLKDSFPSLTRCRYCEHGNPADAKFCSACGGALHLPPHLASCPRCGTVNPVEATACCLCHDELPGRRTDARDSSSPAAEVSRSLLRRPSQVIVALVKSFKDSFLPLTRCPHCKHGNPAHSKFCRACGGAMHLPPHLASCPRCGTANPAKATLCLWCHGQLPGSKPDLLDPSAPAAEVSRSLPRRPSRVIVGTAVLAAIIVLGYYAYRQHSIVDAPQPPAASGEASGRGTPAGAGVVDRNTAAGITESAKAENGAGLISPAAPPSEIPLAPPARAVADQPRAGGELVRSQKAQPAATAITRPQATGAGRAGGQEPPPQTCSETVAALGLCAASPVRPQTTDAGKAGGQEPPVLPLCTEAIAALGLCTPGPTQRRE